MYGDLRVQGWAGLILSLNQQQKSKHRHNSILAEARSPIETGRYWNANAKFAMFFAERNNMKFEVFSQDFAPANHTLFKLISVQYDCLNNRVLSLFSL